MRITLPLLCGSLLILSLGARVTLTGAATPPPDFLSPEQTAPGQVTFRYYAPKATSVSVEGLRHRTPVALARDDAGLWSGTVENLPADIYTYTFNVDGAAALDPRNRYFKKWIVSQSAVEVTGTEPAFFSLQRVPHGVVHRHTYTSAVDQRELSCQVYTPPGYEAAARTRYPLIVLCHGYGDDETAWVEMGRAPLIADNLISKGAMQKAIVVMSYGHAVLPIAQTQAYRKANDAAMEQAVLKQIIPLVEANYHVSRRPEDRAILGLSMGGSHALGIGMAHPEVFHWVAGFSSRAPSENLDQRFNPWIQSLHSKKTAPRLLWIGVGRDDDHLAGNEAFAAWLKQNGIPFTWKVTDGGHEWSVWREYFAEVGQRLFK